MKRNLPIYLLCLGLLLIFSGSVSMFIINLRADQATVLKRMDEVSNVFEEFSTNVSIYEEERDKLYSEIFNNLYYDNMFFTDATVKEKISNYNALVNEIDKKRISLDGLCKDVYYPDSNVNSKCSNYKSIYEQVINYFVTDIKHYNKNVENYNKYIKSLGNTNEISKYQTKYKFIDYNGDGKKDGSEE